MLRTGNPMPQFGAVTEPGIGLEPMTFSLQERCSSN